ncbi:MAG: hypothetical protein RL757_1534 [Bacteroidota bacterium]|jgi:rSAM/selenodomain-associated transferase 1
METVIIFVKNPTLGKVKTRLAKTIGPQNALNIYLKLQEMTRNVVEILGGGQNQPTRSLFYADFINNDDEFKNHLYQKYLQTGDDLGERMQHAFETIFTQTDARRALIIGSDCPTLDATILKDAFEKLETHDFVIGRAHDGGYYLLGMTAQQLPNAPTLFQNMEWSVASVADETLKRIKNIEKTVAFVKTLHDLDEEKDLTPELRAYLNILNKNMI